MIYKLIRNEGNREFYNGEIVISWDFTMKLGSFSVSVFIKI